jgi:hypothetical protein
VAVLHAVNGLLVVATVAPNAKWVSNPTGTFAEREAARNAGYDLYFDVIDAASATIVASTGRITRAQADATMPYDFFKGTLQGYRQAQAKTPGGDAALQVVELRVVARD